MEINVLVAEDCQLSQFHIGIILKQAGFRYEMVNNGSEAIKKLNNNHYEILLLDVQMPELDGFEVATYIRNEMQTRIPIIILTAEIDEELLQRFSTLDIDDWLTKPADENKLIPKIGYILAKTQSPIANH